MVPVKLRSVLVFLLLISIFLTACSSQPAPTSLPAVNPTVQPQLTKTPSKPTQKVQPTLTPTTPPQESNVDTVKRTYHTVLMLERGDDLMMAYIYKVSSGELPLGNSKLRDPYTIAFEVAVSDYNQTDPPTGILNHAWKTVSNATLQLGNVYTALTQGKMISNRDYSNMRSFRQLMTNYQDQAEGYLQGSGLGADFFTSEYQAVEKHFNRVYVDQPIPNLTDSVSK